MQYVQLGPGQIITTKTAYASLVLTTPNGSPLNTILDERTVNVPEAAVKGLPVGLIGRIEHIVVGFCRRNRNAVTYETTLTGSGCLQIDLNRFSPRGMAGFGPAKKSNYLLFAFTTAESPEAAQQTRSNTLTPPSKQKTCLQSQLPFHTHLSSPRERQWVWSSCTFLAPTSSKRCLR